MRLNPIPFFKNRSTRPRAIMWSGVALIVFVVIWAVALDGTSTYWFCTAPCHIVHDDNTAAYQESSHTNVSCIACHEPVDASPLTLTLLKIQVAPDAFKTIFKTFELPMNSHNHVAKVMPTSQCTQCHNMKNRTVTPDEGLIIDHQVHADNKIQCTLCHNRVAHPEENITLTLEGNKKQENWIKMDGCFRCHTQDATAADAAPGACEACHTADFDLMPATHDAEDWYTLYGDSTGHPKAALEESKTVEEALKHAEEAEEPKGHGESEYPEELIPASAVNSCYTCHKPSYCDTCHGTQIPHPEEFKKDHAKAGASDPEMCSRCHARSAAEAKTLGFCNACHHPTSTEGKQWLYQHPETVKSGGADACFDCHAEEQCAYCHVNGEAAFRKNVPELFGK